PSQLTPPTTGCGSSSVPYCFADLSQADLSNPQVIVIGDVQYALLSVDCESTWTGELRVHACTIPELGIRSTSKRTYVTRRIDSPNVITGELGDEYSAVLID